MIVQSESKDTCDRLSIATRGVRDAIRQKADNQKIRAQFLDLAENVSTLLYTLRRDQSETLSLLEGQYRGLFSAVIESLNDAARRKLTDFADVRHACDQINEALCTIQYVKHSRFQALAARSGR